MLFIFKLKIGKSYIMKKGGKTVMFIMISNIYKKRRKGEKTIMFIMISNIYKNQKVNT